MPDTYYERQLITDTIADPQYGPLFLLGRMLIALASVPAKRRRITLRRFVTLANAYGVSLA